MSPEDVHKLAAALVLLFVVVGLAKESGSLSGAWTAKILPAGLVALGVFLVLDPIVFHGGSFGAEGIQHQIQGAILLVVAAIEIGRARGRLHHAVFASALPLTIVAIGLLFVFHSQHGGGDMAAQLAQHRVLGATVVLAGIVKGFDSLGLARTDWAARGWLLLLLAVVIQLFLYVESSTMSGGEPSAGAEHRGH